MRRKSYICTTINNLKQINGCLLFYFIHTYEFAISFCSKKAYLWQSKTKIVIDMKELKCPKCGSVFTVDESDYADIVSQVKNAEFQAELGRRLKEFEKRQTVQQQADELKAEQRLQAKQLEFAQQLAAKDTEIAKLKAGLAEGEAKIRVAVLEEQNKSKDELQKKEQKIAQLQNEMTSKESEAQARVITLKEMYDMQLKEKQTLIDYYKDLKTRLSTKMVGETLEQHCSTQFNTTIRTLLPNAYFEKDNDASEGSKGDFIFRDKDDDFEYISIMFEMKNESDTTANRHKNEDFLKKLDDDRRKKGCEYAVLVSLLEPDNETYNTGIVDMSHRYEKMYVIRPQFFIPIITLLVQAAKKSLDYKRQLVIAQSKEVDVTNFEAKLNEFRDLFGKNVKNAHDRFQDAIAAIDKSIADLQKVKDNLLKSDDHLRLANGKVDDLTIRKLTYKNPTMKAKFDEARDVTG